MATRKPSKGAAVKKTTPIVKVKTASTKLKKTPEKKTDTKSVASKPVAKTVNSKPIAKQPVQKNTSVKKAASNKSYVRLSMNADSSKFREMGEKLKNGKVKWAFYAIDGEIGYHYYEVL